MARTVSGLYSYTLVDQAGQTSAYTFLSLFNPASSGIKIAIRKVDYQAYAVAVTIAKVSKRFSRISSASGGAAVSAGAIAKHLTTYNSPTGVARITNPTVGQVADIKAFPPAVCITAVGTYGSPEIDFDPKEEVDEIILLEDQGISIYQTAAGDADETMNIRVVWMEYTDT